MKTTQEQQVIDFISMYGSIDCKRAVEHLAVHRLSGVIYNLKKQGYSFNTVMKTGRNRFGQPSHWAEYSLDKEAMSA